MRWGWSDAAEQALAGEHTAVSKLEIRHSGQRVYTLALTDGQVELDATRAVRANTSCTAIDPTGGLSRGDIGDLLNPYDCEIAPYRGVVHGPADRRVTELAPLGVFRLTGRRVSDSPDGLTINLKGLDRAMVYQGPMDSAMAISAGTPAEMAIQRLLSRRQPGLSLSTMRTGFNVGPLLFEPDIDVWAEAQKIAESVGARLFHDRYGQPTLGLAGPVNDRPVATYAEGDGRLLDIDRAEDSDTINNVVVAENHDGSIRVVVEDTDPTSPTYSRGPYGRRVLTLRNPYFGSLRQALQAASTRLAYELGRSETVDFTAIPDPGLEELEVVTVHRPRAGLTHRGVVTSSLTIPLKVVDGGRVTPMQVGCRQSRLAQDGRILPDLPAAAA